MFRHHAWLVALTVIAGATGLGAQVTGTPSFSAPYRVFAHSEIGAVVSAPAGYGTAFEAAYGYPLGTLDIGLRGGMYSPGTCCRTEVLLGAQARDRVIAHSAAFPFDGALIVGLGGAFVNGGSTAYVPVGLSLGRRLSPASSLGVTPYVQPTATLVAGGGTAIDFTLGLGADLRLSDTFAARLSAGVGDLHGIALGAVWLN